MDLLLLGISVNIFFFYISTLLDGWSEESHKYTRGEHGKWNLTIPALSDGSCPISHDSVIKVRYSINIPRYFAKFRWQLKKMVKLCTNLVHGLTMLHGLATLLFTIKFEESFYIYKYNTGLL